MSGFGWVTLATNDTYSLGALVLAHSLRRVGTVHQLIVMVTPGVTQSMREKLRSVFDLIFEVNILDSKDERNLLLLKRPELGITFTKMHCWRLTQYLKCVFVDADTLVLQNCDELFDREEFSAAPDVGWPDCFNSGVFVYRPSEETFNSLLAFALERGSFDGGDQGLLNLYFSDWAHQDINKHLPFIYNMCSTACYSYLPAFKQFGENVKIVHFIGNSKPWLQYFNSETLQVSSSPNFEHLQQVFELWWNLFCTHVHSNLQPTMARINTSIASSCTSSSHSFAYFLNESKCEDSLCTEQSCGTDVIDIDIPPWDPWEHYQPVNSVDVEDSHSADISNLDVNNESNSNLNFVENNENKTEFSFHESYNYNNTQSYNDNVISNVNIECIECNSQGDSSHNFEQQIEHVGNISLADPPPNTCIYNKTPPVESPSTYQSITPTVLCDAKSARSVTVSTEQSALATASNTVLCDANSASTVTISTEQNAIATASNTEPRTESNGGLAGAFAQMTLRQPRSADQTALEDHLRRQGWEAGRIDYLGQDSFENVWKKICETMGTAPKKEQSPPKQAPLESPTPDPTAAPTASSIPGAELVLPPTSTSLAETGTSTTSAAEPAVISTPTLAAEPAVVSTPALTADSTPLSSPAEPVTASGALCGTEPATPPIPAVEPTAVSYPAPASTTEPSIPAAESAALPPPVPIADPVPVSAVTAEPTTVATPPAESAAVAAPIPIAEPAVTPTSAVEPTGISALVSASIDESTIVSTPAAESAAVAAPVPVAEPATHPTPAAEPAPASAPVPDAEPTIVSTPGTEPSISPTPVAAPIPATEPAAAPIRAVSASTPAAETAAVSASPPTAESAITSTLVADSTLAPAPEPALAPSATKAAAASAPAPGVEHIATTTSEDASTPAAEPSAQSSAPTVVPTSAPVSGLTQETPQATASATVTTSKPADQSSTMPVPPPRKSGKNGAGAKKTSKKK